MTAKELLEHEIFQDIKPSIVRNFIIYHRENPHVFDLFKRFAVEAKKSGRKRYGAKMIAERCRWNVNIETKSRDDFKISNNHTSCYARLLCLWDPNLKTFFTLKKSRYK